jgi:hypothetical protein
VELAEGSTSQPSVGDACIQALLGEASRANRDRGRVIAAGLHVIVLLPCKKVIYPNIGYVWPIVAVVEIGSNDVGSRG